MDEDKFTDIDSYRLLDLLTTATEAVQAQIDLNKSSCLVSKDLISNLNGFVSEYHPEEAIRDWFNSKTCRELEGIS